MCEPIQPTRLSNSILYSPSSRSSSLNSRQLTRAWRLERVRLRFSAVRFSFRRSQCMHHAMIAHVPSKALWLGQADSHVWHGFLPRLPQCGRRIKRLAMPFRCATRRSASPRTKLRRVRRAEEVLACGATQGCAGKHQHEAECDRDVNREPWCRPAAAGCGKLGRRGRGLVRDERLATVRGDARWVQGWMSGTLFRNPDTTDRPRSCGT